MVSIRILPWLLWTCIAISAQSADRRFTVKRMVGAVKARKGDSPSWLDARMRMVLKEKDAIRTFVESEVEIEGEDGTSITISENTTLELAHLRQQGAESRTTTVRILNGKVLSNIKKLAGTGSSFEFETPTATAAVRGTTVGLDVTGEGTTIRVYEGAVYVVPRGASAGAEVKSNQMTVIQRNQSTVTIVDFTEKATVAASAPSDTSHRDTSSTDSASAPQGETPGSDSSTADSRGDSVATRRDTLAAATTLQLTITSPQEGIIYPPGSRIEFIGRVTPASAGVTVDGKSVPVSASGDFRNSITASTNPGDYSIEFEAVSAGNRRVVVRSVKVQAPVVVQILRLAVNSPREGQVFSTGLIPLQGVTSPGAEVVCSGIRFRSSADGSFSGQLAIPDEEGQLELEIEATLGDKTMTVVRKIVYKKEAATLTLTIHSPAEGQVYGMTSVQVGGVVIPANAEVVVADRTVPVSASGAFTTIVTIPAEEGEHTIECEAAKDGRTATVQRKVVYRKPPDTEKPILQPGSLPRYSPVSKLVFTVLDRTPDDEITFYRAVDGSVESETGQPNSRFTLELQEGVHTYAVYAADRQGNQSARPSGKVVYLSRTPVIRMRKPLGSELVRIPPGAPGGEFEPVYTVSFSVENLPDEDPAVLRELIREVTVTNRATNRSYIVNTVDNAELEFDVHLKRDAVNEIDIRLIDINNRTVTPGMVPQIHVR